MPTPYRQDIVYTFGDPPQTTKTKGGAAIAPTAPRPFLSTPTCHYALPADDGRASSSLPPSAHPP